MERVVIEKGEVFTCPLCGDEVAMTKKAIRVGDTIGLKNIKFLEGDFKTGDPFRCPSCKFPFAVDVEIAGKRGAIIHTKKGWRPAYYDLFRKNILTSIRKFLESKGQWREEWNEKFEKAIEGEGI